MALTQKSVVARKHRQPYLYPAYKPYESPKTSNESMSNGAT